MDKMPAEVIKLSMFLIPFPFHDSAMFVGRDCALGLVFNFGPELYLDDWPRKLVHAEAIVVKFAQQHIGADGPDLHAGKQVFRLRFNDDKVPN